MKLIALILSLLLILNSCSSLNTEIGYDRLPANSPVSFDEVMSIKKSGKKSKDLKKEFTSMVTQGLAPNNTMGTELKLANDLPKDVAFKLELDIVDGKYIYRVLHSADAFTDHAAVVEMANFATNVSQGMRFITHFSDFEMYYNARENDPESLNNFLKLRMQENYDSLSAKYDGGDFSSILKERIAETKELSDQLAPVLKAQSKARKLTEEKRKAALDSLDKVAKDEQFKALIAKNDRKGVAELLKKYLPYEDMAPFERRFWDNALDVIANPLPLHQRIFVYRGIDDDQINTAIEHGVELDTETAIKENKTFLMSTIMTKNQGSYNRRLRSLEAMNEKTIGVVGGSSEFARSARITTMFKNHSGDPVGSPFLSFTPDVGVASSFGYKRNSAYLIDPRAIHFNFTSGFENEKEFLSILVTFPDEMVAFWDQQYHAGQPVEQFFKTRLAERIEAEFGKADKDKILAEIEKNTYDYFSPVFKKGTTKPKSGFLGTIADFFKGFSKKSSTPKPDVNTSGDLSCDHLIKSFWVK